MFNPSQKQQYVVPDNVDPRAWYAPPSSEMLDGWVPDFKKFRRQWTSGITEDPDQLWEIMEQGGSPWPITYTFLPNELKNVLQQGPARRQIGRAGSIVQKYSAGDAQKNSC